MLLDLLDDRGVIIIVSVLLFIRYLGDWLMERALVRRLLVDAMAEQSHQSLARLK